MKRFALLLVTFAATALSADSIIRCESDGSLRECRFDGPADISISRQLSKSSCIEGRSWGVNGNRIWVDRGCRADFLVDNPRGDRRGETIICESNGRKQWCSADTSNGVRLSRQLSRSSCDEGSSWGFTNRGIWVDNGCRAEFRLGRRGGWGDNNGGGYGHRSELVVCESENNNTRRCSIENRGATVRLSRQLSRNDCIYGRTWGYNDREIWVRDGCRAEFSVGGR